MNNSEKIIPFRSESLSLLEELKNKTTAKLRDLLRRARLEKAEPNSMTDLECVIVEESDIQHLRLVLDEWIENLSSCPNDAVRHGIASGLLEFDSYLDELEKEQKEIFGE